MQKILIIRLSSLGDVILTTPILKAVKELYPGSQLDYCTKSDYADVIRLNPNVDNIIKAENNLSFDKLKILKKLLRRNDYDLIIDAHNKLNTFYLRLFSGCKKLKLKKYSIRKFLLVKFKINLMKSLPPINQRYVKILNPLLRGLPAQPGVSKDEPAPLIRGGVSPEISTDYASSKIIADFFINLNIQNNKNIFCIVPSAKHFTKTYPPELYAELINKFDADKFTFLLIGKGKDKDNIESIISKTGQNVYNLCDKFNVLELAELMKRCSLVITGDTGPMHIAEAVGTHIIMLAGSSVREFGFYPQSQNAVILENNNLSCRPCSHIGLENCPKVHFKCMRGITPARISEYIY